MGHIAIIIFALLLEGFFSGTETALVSCNKIRIRHKADKGNPTARIVWALLKNPHRMLATTLVGTNICVVTGSIVATDFCIRLFGERGPMISTLIMVPIILIFGEMLPKSLFRLLADKIIFVTAPLLVFFQKFLFPIVIVVEGLSGIVIKGLGLRKTKKDPFLTIEDIELLVRQITREGVLERSEQGAIHQIFDFRYTRVGDIMIRLRNVISIDYNDNREKIIERARIHGFTRYPVIENKRIKGVLNIFDIFYNDGDWHKYIRPLRDIYSNQRINQVLYKMQRNKEIMSAVVRKGKFIGIVTLKDIINEIELI